MSQLLHNLLARTSGVLPARVCARKAAEQLLLVKLPIMLTLSEPMIPGATYIKLPMYIATDIQLP